MKELRFTVGTDVLCNLGEEGWKLGKVVDTHYREASWPTDRVAAYQVSLEAEMTLVYVPEDDDRYCRKATTQDVMIVRHPDALASAQSRTGDPTSQAPDNGLTGQIRTDAHDYRSGNCHGCNRNPQKWSYAEMFSHHYGCAGRNGIRVTRHSYEIGTLRVGEEVNFTELADLPVSAGFMQCPTLVRLPPGVRFSDAGSLSGSVRYDPFREKSYRVRFVAVSTEIWEDPTVGLVRLEIEFTVEGNTPPVGFDMAAFQQDQFQAREKANRILMNLHDAWDQWEQGDAGNRETCDVMCSDLGELRKLLAEHPRLDGGVWWAQLGGFYMNVHKLLENTLFECELYLGYALTFDSAQVRRHAEANLEGCYNKRLLEAARFMWMDGAKKMLHGEWEAAAKRFHRAAEKKDGWGWAVNYGDIWLGQALARLVVEAEKENRNGSSDQPFQFWLEETRSLLERCKERADESEAFGPAGHPWAAEVEEALVQYLALRKSGEDMTAWLEKLNARTLYWCGRILAGVPPFPPQARARLEDESDLIERMPKHID